MTFCFSWGPSSAFDQIDWVLTFSVILLTPAITWPQGDAVTAVNVWGRLRCMAMLGAIRVFKRIVVFEEFYDCKGSIRLFSIMQHLLRGSATTPS